MPRELTNIEKELIAHAKEQYNHWRSVLQFYGELPDNDCDSHTGNDTQKVKLNSFYNFNDFLRDIFADGQPRLTQELRDEFIKKTGKDIDLKNFSSKLNTVRKRGKVIKNAKFEYLPLDKRHWWGLIEWFEGEDFKKEYEEKIPDLHRGVQASLI